LSRIACSSGLLIKNASDLRPAAGAQNSSRWPSQTARDDITKGSNWATIAHLANGF